ncbi:MAG: hypothetical protein R3D58_22480 [Saprospiraceae bacterium]
MTRFFVLGLLFLISTPVLIKTGVLGWYMWNKAEIIARECINRNKPEKRCNGKCYLAKQLKIIDNPAQNDGPVLPVKLWEKAETAAFLLPDGSAPLIRLEHTRQLHCAVFGMALPRDQMVFRQIFKPPG